MTLFDLPAVAAPVLKAGFAADFASLEEGVIRWAQALEARFTVTYGEGRVTVGNVTVDYSSAHESSEAMRLAKEQALEAGEELYYVFPWEIARLKQMLSHFNSRLGLDSRSFAARRLAIRLVPQKEADSFMKVNHIQGSASGSQKVSIGLYHKETDELLAVQQYCKSRWMVKKVAENPGIWEGLRLAIKSDVQIYGGATRLQKEFLKSYHPTELMSYVDFSHSLGSYKKVQGFAAGLTAQDAFMWVLKTPAPNGLMIRDKHGVERHADMSIVRATPYVNPNTIAGPFGKGVGRTFFGGKLGSRKELLEQGNAAFHNDLVLEALGYERVFTAGQLKWSKKFPENEGLSVVAEATVAAKGLAKSLL